VTDDQPTAAPDPAADPEDLAFDVPDLAIPDEAAIRRAVRRGVLKSGLAAASWLLVVALVLAMAAAGIGALRVERFALVAEDGVRVAHPEYEVEVGPFSNLGVSTLDVRLRPRGAFGHPGVTDGRIVQRLFGGIDVDLGPRSDTPIGDALSRARPDGAATGKFLDGLPPQVSVSAVVELDRPLSRDAFFDLARMVPAPVGNSETVFLTDPYAHDEIVSWPDAGVDNYVRWARKLGSDDDDALRALGLPRASALRALADHPQVHAYVVERASVKQLRALLADRRVRSVNVADVGFDPASQSGG
jgi:hypothetical protein